MEEKQREEKKVIFLKGKKVILRPMNVETDLVNCHRWINDPKIRHFVMNYLPLSIGQEHQWLERAIVRNDGIVLAIETLSGEFIGNMSMVEIDNINRTAITGALIGEKEYRGKGYGTDAKMIFLNYAFNTLNLRKICSSVIAYNERSHKYLLRTGYREEGRQVAQVFHQGKYWDHILLAVFREDWEPLWQKYLAN